MSRALTDLDVPTESVAGDERLSGVQPGRSDVRVEPARWSEATAQAVWKSRLPKCLQRGVAGKIAAYTREDGTVTKPMTVKFLTDQKYFGGRTLGRREVQHQLRALERIGFIYRPDPTAYVGRNHPREYRVNVAALASVDPTAPTTYPRAGARPRKGEPLDEPKSKPLGEPKGEPLGELFPMTYTDPVPDDPGSETGEPISSAGCTAPTKEQRRANERAACRDVSQRIRWRDHAAFDADLATLPLPGLFASPKLARRVGYEIFDANPGEIFETHVAMLQAALQAKGIATEQLQCRWAMADVYTERSMRDRAWDRAADRDRRRLPR